MVKPLSHIRNLTVASLAVLLIFLLATQPFPIAVQAQDPELVLDPTRQERSGDPGDTVTFEFTLRNNTGEEIDADVDVLDLPGDYVVVIPTPSFRLASGGTATIEILITIPEDEPATTEVGRLRVRAETQDTDRDVEANAQIEIVVTGPTRTPTNTPSRTDTPTPTEGLICEDAFENDDDLDSARVIDVNTTQEHTICPAGDEDWLVFGAVGGKVFTIDIVEMDPGLDLSLALYNEDGELLAFNDDFFDRDPPDPNDLRPRIQSWQSPEDGRYYIRVRDAAGRGAVDRRYVIGLFGESGGPTPTTVVDVCLDLFEPDGLPEQARLITSNELQEDRRLCPEGDADWVTFFGKAGKRYFIFTETSRYRGENQVNRETQAGADTVMVLTDRDGVSIIDINDDIPGGETLDSQIEFIPEVDGFYYVQIKNVGDIGNQFIRYDLVLQLCVPGQTDCGRPSTSDPDLPRPQPGEPVEEPSPTVVATPIEEFTLDEAEDLDLTTPTPTTTPTVDAASAPDAQEPLNTVALQLPEFAAPAFQQLWQRYDQVIVSQRVQRSWMWGPASLMIRTEEYRQADGGARQVQYFDKGRMELRTSADQEDARAVTHGLLVQEMISGHIQFGDNEFVAHQPANIALAGDSDSASAPTYASLHSLVNIAFDDRTGTYVQETLGHNGSVGVYRGPRREAARFVRFVLETGHNIPAVFWEFLNQRGEIYANGRYTSGPIVDWLATVGYPISEPYWLRARIDGEQRDVLVQAFQRRILTYTPDNPSDWQVEMGNAGRHYYQWRYGIVLP